MKILTIDDQELILLSVEKRLQELGFDVQTANSGQKGIALFNSYQPDLVLVDINMPDMSGLDVVKHIRNASEKQIPILVMSGNTQEDVIMDGFSLGIDDYMKKPVSLDEMSARIKRLIGAPEVKSVVKNSIDTRMLQQHCVGVVIPCYNEEERLLSDEFLTYIDKNSGYHLCFVNDGSTDKTLEVLLELKKSNPENISIYNCEKND